MLEYKAALRTKSVLLYENSAHWSFFFFFSPVKDWGGCAAWYLEATKPPRWAPPRAPACFQECFVKMARGDLTQFQALAELAWGGHGLLGKDRPPHPGGASPGLSVPLGAELRGEGGRSGC